MPPIAAAVEARDRSLPATITGSGRPNSIHASALGYGPKISADRYFSYLHEPWDLD